MQDGLYSVPRTDGRHGNPLQKMIEVHIMDQIEKEFHERAIQRGGMCLYNAQDAIAVIRRCKELNMVIIGMDAYMITDLTIQPFFDYSINYTSVGFQTGNWEEAEAFISRNAEKDFVFEVLYD